MTPLTPVEITPGSASAWVDADLSALIPSGATGISLHIENSGADLAVGFRKNGSTDNRIQSIVAAGHFFAQIGVDGSRIVELYVGSTTSVSVWLTGYYESEAVFLTNGVDKSTATTGSWVDVVISSDTGADTAIVAFVEIVRTGIHDVGLRKNGSTDNRVVSPGLHGFGVVGVDGSEIFEQQISNAALDIFLVGYVKSGAVFYDNGIDRSLSTTGAWTDLAALPSGAVAGIYESIGSSSVANDTGLRKNGSSEAIIWILRHNWPIVECDASQLVEMWIETTAVDIFELGYFTSGSQTLTPSLFTNSQTFYAPTVTVGAVTLTPLLFTNNQTFYAPTVSSAVTLTPNLFTNTNTFHGPTVSQGFLLEPSLFTNSNTFYDPTVTVGSVTLSPSLVVNSNVFFGPTVSGGEVSTGGGAYVKKRKRAKTKEERGADWQRTLAQISRVKPDVAPDEPADIPPADIAPSSEPMVEPIDPQDAAELLVRYGLVEPTPTSIPQAVPNIAKMNQDAITALLLAA